MQIYLLIGGGKDGLTILAPEDMETIHVPILSPEDMETRQLPVVITAAEAEAYIRETLSVGDTSVTIYRHESLTSQQVLDLLIQHYKAWAVNRPLRSRIEND